MNSSRLRPAFFLSVWLFSGCAARRYQPAPIIPTETALKLQSRSLVDAGLQAFVEKSVGHALAPWPPKTWDPGTLSLAALYFNPVLETARARVAEAEAAVVTAGARPNPSLSIAPGVPSPYLFNLDLSVPVETAGKRGHRIQVARSLNRAAQFDLADSAWKVRSAVRSALLNFLRTFRNLELLRSEEELRREQVTLLQQRLSAGEIPRPEVDLARIELSKTHLAISAVEGELGESKSALAASIGIPVTALRGVEFSWSDLDSPPTLESLSELQIQREAVLNRMDVRRALAQYTATEADLQLEIAKQYPDIQIGPGYAYEERNSFFTIGFSTTLPIFNRNQGPITEAEARRRQAGAVFLATQAQVIAESERAFALYAAALKELNEADQSLGKLQVTQEQTVERAVRIGQEDRLALSGMRIESSVVARARLDALARAQKALGELEDVVQRPLAPGDMMPLTFEFPLSNEHEQGAKP